MAESKSKTVGIRLSVQDADVARRALAAFGEDGAAALKHIEAAGRPASASLGVLSASIAKSRETGGEFFKEMARSALGPAAAFLSIAGAVEGVRAAMERLSTIKDAARNAGLDPELLQTIAYQAQLTGVKFQDTASALQTFYKNAGQAGDGIGRMQSQLKTLDPELLKNIQLATTQEERVKLVADALKNETDGSKAAAIATALFGQNGVRLVQTLREGREELDKNKASLMQMGAVMGDDVVERGAELNEQFNALTTVLGNQFTQVLVDLGPLLLGIATILTTVASAVRLVVEGVLEDFEGLDAVSTASLETRLDGIKKSIAAAAATVPSGPRLDPTTGKYAEITEGGITRIDTDAMGKTGSGAMAQAPDAVDIDKLTAQQKQIEEVLALRKKLEDASSTVLKGTVPTPPDAAAKIQKVSDALKLEITNLGLSGRQQEINNEVGKAGLALDDSRADEIKRLAGSLYDEKAAIEAVNDATNFLAQTGEQAFEGLIDGSKSWLDVLGDLASTLEKAVLQAALLGQGPLAGLFGTKSDNGQDGGVLGTLLGGVVGALTHSSLPSLPTGGTAGFFPGLTGPLLHAKGGISNRPAIFGEAGPEAAVPLPDGRSIPVTLRGSGQQISVTINHLPGSGEDTVTATQNGNVMQIEATVRSIVGKAISTPGNDIRKGFTRTFGLRPQLTKR